MKFEVMVWKDRYILETATVGNAETLAQTPEIALCQPPGKFPSPLLFS